MSPHASSVPQPSEEDRAAPAAVATAPIAGARVSDVRAGEARVVTESLGGGALARLAIAGEAPEEWYPRAPRGARAWRERAESVAATAPAEWRRALGPAFAFADGAAERNPAAARLARARVVVTTGQQPGLFGGPVYTWSKAMTALALADALERETGIPTAPVFWAATDDADLAEASETWVALPGGAERLVMRADAPEGTPMSRVPLPPLAAELARLAEGAGSLANAPALDLARRAYAQGTVASAYLALLRGVLEPLGVSVLDASHPAVRAAGAPTMRAALANAGAVDEALARRENELHARGFAPQVPRVAGRSLVFSLADGTKRRVGVGEAAEAARTVADADLAPNVLLRPLVERAILPTVAYLAGPGELAYFAQVSAVADVIGAARPLALPRWSGTILEPHVERALATLGVAREELADGNAVRRRLARAAMPAPLADAIAAWRAAVIAGERAVHEASGDLLDARVAEGAATRMHARIDRVERRALAALARRDETSSRLLAMARGALHPGGLRQERALNLVPLLARYGAALLDQMRARAGEHADALIGGRS